MGGGLSYSHGGGGGGVRSRLTAPPPARQHADSLQRLGCGFVDALVIHDIEQCDEPAGNPKGLSAEQHRQALLGTAVAAGGGLSICVATVGAGTPADM